MATQHEDFVEPMSADEMDALREPFWPRSTAYAAGQRIAPDVQFALDAEEEWFDGLRAGL